MMDNLLAEGKALPMVIAIPNNQVIHRNHPKHAELTFDMFEAELRKHVIPLVESAYNVRKDPRGRALSGLSMGGRHTMFIGFRSLDLFANFGILSAGDVDAEKSIAKFLNDPQVNQKVAYLFVGQGTEEAKGRWEPVPWLCAMRWSSTISSTSTMWAATAATIGRLGGICSTPGSCRICGGPNR